MKNFIRTILQNANAMKETNEKSWIYFCVIYGMTNIIFFILYFILTNMILKKNYYIILWPEILHKVLSDIFIAGLLILFCINKTAKQEKMSIVKMVIAMEFVTPISYIMINKFNALLFGIAFLVYDVFFMLNYMKANIGGETVSRKSLPIKVALALLISLWISYHILY